MILFLELVPRILAAAYLAGGHLVVSYFLAARLLPDAGLLVRACAMFVVGLATATVAFHLLIPFHLFLLPVALAGLSLLLAAVLAPAENRAAIARRWRADRRTLRRVLRLVRRSPRRGWVTVFALCALVVIVRPLVTPPISWDGLMYHAMKAALWVKDGGPALVLDRAVPSWDLTRNTLAGGAVFHAWAMLPMRGDLLYGAVQSVQWIALGLAAIALARELGMREPFASVTAALLISLAPIRLEVGSGYVEIVEALTLALGLLFTLRALRRPDTATVVLAAASFGLAFGIKIIVIPLCALALVFLAVAAARRRRWGALGLGALTFVALAAPWPIYNTIDTGYPLSPVPVKVLGFELGRASAAVKHVTETPPEQPDPDVEWTSLQITFATPARSREALGLLALPPLIVFILAAPWLARRRPGAAGLLLALFAGNLLLVYGPNFTTMRHVFPEGVSRFLVPLAVVAVPASAAWCSMATAAGRAYFALLLGLTFFHQLRFLTLGMAPDEQNGIAVLLLAAVAVALVARLAARRLRREPRLAVTLLAAAVALAGFNLYRDTYRYDGRDAFLLHPLGHAWQDPGRAVDDPDHPYRIAVTHGLTRRVDTGLFYMLLGRRLQNDLVHVPTTKNGRDVLDPLRDWRQSNFKVWLDRLRAQKVDFVASWWPATIELAYMEANTNLFERIHGEPGMWGLFRLKPGRP